MTGGFDPIHPGHLELFEAASKIEDCPLVAGVNSDAWLTRKKTVPFLDESARIKLLKANRLIDDAFLFDDGDGSANNAIKQALDIYDHVYFVNGGDRNTQNIPEFVVWQHDPRVSFIDTDGPKKQYSSSTLLENWKQRHTDERVWGRYTVLTHKPGIKVKELIIDPGKSLSTQVHEYRDEHWYIFSGTCSMKINDLPELALLPGDSYLIKRGDWHKASNKTSLPVRVIEIQTGQPIIESDIIRK